MVNWASAGHAAGGARVGPEMLDSSQRWKMKGPLRKAPRGQALRFRRYFGTTFVSPSHSTSKELFTSFIASFSLAVISGSCSCSAAAT